MLNLSSILENITNNLQDKYKFFGINPKLIKPNFTRHVTYIPKIIKHTEIRQILKQFKQFENKEFLLEKKLDGILINITYNEGKLISIITKGNRHGGKNLTEQLYNHKDIPHIIPYNNILEVRCEIVLTNQKYKDYYATEFVDARTCVSGNANKKEIDSKFVELIDIYAHDISILGKDKYTTQTNIYHDLNTWGFKTINFNILPYVELEYNIVVVLSQIKASEYMCDGCIIKINDINTQLDLMHENAKIAKYTIAFKANQIIITKVKKVDFVISKDASILPTIEIEPIECDDKHCKSLTLYSYALLESNKIQEGDEIRVKYNTTFVYDGIETKKNNDPFIGLSACPGCKTELLQINKKIYCQNSACYAKNIAILYSYAKIKGIKSIGPSIITLLVTDYKIITIPIDIFDATIQAKTIQALTGQKSFGPKKIQGIIEGLDYIQNTATALDIIMLLGIPSLGQETANKLAIDMLNILNNILHKSNVVDSDFDNYQYLNKPQKHNIANFFNQNKSLLSKITDLIKQTKQNESN